MPTKYTEIDGEIALFCEIVGIPIKHYDTTFKITEENLERAVREMLWLGVIRLIPTQSYIRECCKF
jgi:hypothetical protein